MNIAAGTRLGRYEIRSKIGAGGMGQIYLARDTSELDRTGGGQTSASRGQTEISLIRHEHERPVADHELQIMIYSIAGNFSRRDVEQGLPPSHR